MKKEPGKKAEIAQAANTLFKQYGIKKVTVEEISREAGTSKMTFYKYFPNKNELVRHIWQTMIENSMSKIDDIDCLEISFAEKINLLVEMKEEATSEMGNEYIHDYLSIVPELQEFYDRIFGQVMVRFMAIIRKAQEKGEVRQSMRPEFFLAVVQQMMELAKNEPLAALYENYSDFAMEVNNFLYYGLMPIPEAEQK